MVLIKSCCARSCQGFPSLLTSRDWGECVTQTEISNSRISLISLCVLEPSEVLLCIQSPPEGNIWFFWRTWDMLIIMWHSNPSSNSIFVLVPVSVCECVSVCKNCIGTDKHTYFTYSYVVLLLSIDSNIYFQFLKSKQRKMDQTAQTNH